MDNKTRVVISGYYGFDNIGDEAILYTMIKMLKISIPNISIVVLSNNPKMTEQLYNVKSVNRWNIKCIVQNIKNCDLLISGGGSLLQDVTSIKTIPYYLGIIKIALMCNKKVVFYSQGIGPINKKINRYLVKNISNKIEHIFVRDTNSKRVLQSMGVKTPIDVSIDPVFGIQIDENEYSEIKQQLSNKKSVGIYLRPWKNNNLIINCMSKVILSLIQDDYEVYMICMQPEQDIKIAKDVAKRVESNHLKIIEQSLTINKTLSYTANFDFIIGMRLHSLIMAVATNTPVIALSYDPKVENVMSEMQLHHHIKIDEISPNEILSQIKYIEQNLESEVKFIKYIKEERTQDIYIPIDHIKKILQEEVDGT
ncbi:MAG: polysaccharide pyruvyl transferase CsaB [Epulopiscium sp. Nuni2H_MBin003]|nr:MAG: polysaccharide pyruvyl transferase CsaB [Epulopiscium sp. Nuni2H_MBin003]